MRLLRIGLHAFRLPPRRRGRRCAVSERRASTTVDKQEQLRFHEEYYAEEGPRPQQKFYVVTNRSYDYFSSLALPYTDGRRVLDYCCGTGKEAVKLARSGARVWGVDLSSVAISQARDLAREAGVEDRVTFQVMDAEHLEFEDDSFDMVYGLGSIHHLTLEDAYSEVARVLRPEGRVIFSEPMAYNPVVNLYRRFTPEARTHGEHRLTRADLALARRYFRRVHEEFFHFTVFAAAPFYGRPGFRQLRLALDAVDVTLFKIPGAKWLAWSCIFTLDGPVKCGGGALR